MSANKCVTTVGVVLVALLGCESKKLAVGHAYPMDNSSNLVFSAIYENPPNADEIAFQRKIVFKYVLMCSLTGKFGDHYEAARHWIKSKSSEAEYSKYVGDFVAQIESVELAGNTVVRNSKNEKIMVVVGSVPMLASLVNLSEKDKSSRVAELVSIPFN